VRQALSEREREVLRLVSVGHTSAEIATKLSLSVQTVNTHIRNIYRKLHVKSRAQAVNLAAHQRLI
jgi:DNA-binding CsgD family transcriptional regulator